MNDETKLSDDARCVATAYFGLGRVGSAQLTFAMVQSKPTARGQAALDELVSAGILTKEPLNVKGGVTYTLAKEFKKESMAFVERNTFYLTEPIRP